MSRNTFASLLKKYQSGNASPRERQVVEQWYALLQEEPRPLSPNEWEKLEVSLWQKLKKRSFEDEPSNHVKVQPLWKLSWLKTGVAASIIVLLTVGLLYKYKNKGTDITQQAGEMELVANRTSSVITVTLEDSSKVWLNPGGELRFPNRFTEQKREVFLTGEAFFEVSENPNRPFLVNAGQITTKVLGTSFRIKAPRNGPEVEVSVKTGKVSVYEKDKADVVYANKIGNGVILNRNHQVTFIAKNKVFVTRLVDQPLPLLEREASEPNMFYYNDTPLSKVIDQLEEVYRINLEVDRAALRDCPLTANLSKKGLYAQLDLICAAIQGTYEVRGTTILISGRGCE